MMKKTLILLVTVLLFTNVFAQSGGGKTVEKDGLFFSVLVYANYYKKQPLPESHPDWYAPVVRTGPFQIRCIAANYNYNGKVYTMNSFGGKLNAAFSELTVTEVVIKAIFNTNKCGTSSQISECIGPNEERINTLSCGYTKDQEVKMTSIEFPAICKIEGLSALHQRIRELEQEESNAKKKEEEAKSKAANTNNNSSGHQQNTQGSNKNNSSDNSTPGSGNSSAGNSNNNNGNSNNSRDSSSHNTSGNSSSTGNNNSIPQPTYNGGKTGEQVYNESIERNNAIRQNTARANEQATNLGNAAGDMVRENQQRELREADTAPCQNGKQSFRI